jgi:hypothetical protein
MKSLYKVYLQGFKGIQRLNPIYVAAQHPTEAYNKVKDYLDCRDYGFKRDRELEKIELVAQDSECTNLNLLVS